VCLYYMNGRGTTQDFEKAKYWAELAMENGNISASAELGSIYFFGRGTLADNQKGLEYFEIASRKGISYTTDWFKALAETGVDQSTFSYLYGNCLYFGAGCEKDKSVAAGYYSQSNLPEAYYMMGKMYLEGDGVEQNNEHALINFKSSAEAGYKKAVMYALCLETGEGPTQTMY